jgi:uncharacterized membrane protein YfcA
LKSRVYLLKLDENLSSAEMNILFSGYPQLFNFIALGLIGGVVLASSGMIGPLLVPALLLLGLPSGMARGTGLASELLMTLVSLIIHRQARNLDKRVMIAFLPGAITVALGASISVKFSESFMNLAIGIFEIVIGVVMIINANWPSKRYSMTVMKKTTMAKLMLVAVLAGFAKGFFGVGWGPLGVALFILMGINPRVVVGSSLAIRLLLDCVGGLTYANMSLVDVHAVVIVALAGCVTVPLSVKFTTMSSERVLSTALGLVVAFLDMLVIVGFQ